MKSREMRRLANAWTQNPWPQHLEWLEIDGLRGWTGQRVDFTFPIVAIVGENGTGKSTIIQAAASSYRAPNDERGFFASDFFPDTPYEKVTGVSIRASVRQGEQSTTTSVRKPTTRWRGNPQRKIRNVEYLDLRRTQPIYARTGYSRLAKGNIAESAAENFDDARLTRLSAVLGKNFGGARQSLTDADPNRRIPVLSFGGQDYSGFHQGAGESTIMDLLALPLPNYGLILIDEVETSLHPRAQRRLIRDLAERARHDHLQIIVTTHSPYILEELPSHARVQVVATTAGKDVVRGVSPEFALTKMDDDVHPEEDIYVEDIEAKIFLEEVLANTERGLLTRTFVTPFGAASVGKSLGIMVAHNRFSRPTVVFLDGDQEPAEGCHILPGEDAPERVVFASLEETNWQGIAQRINRSHAELVDQCQHAMTLPNHHDWIRSVADNLILGGNDLWRAMCISYVTHCLADTEKQRLRNAVKDVLESP
jgi:predicted ATPase